MKIIFDSKEQKERVVGYLANEICPSMFGLEEKHGEEPRGEERCRRCWRRAIEIEVEKQ